MSGHRCNCCLSRRKCLQLLSLSAVGAALPGVPVKAAPEPEGSGIDTASLRPNPTVRISAAFLERPRPYRLGWPGTAYPLDEMQAKYRQQLADSGQRLGITATLVDKPIDSADGLTSWMESIEQTPPDAVLVILQHMSCWDQAAKVADRVKLPLLIFAPIGTAFTGHISRLSRREGVHVISGLEWSGVEAGLRLVRAKRRFEETRVLWIRGKEANETVLDRFGTKVRAVPRDTFNELFNTVKPTAEINDIASDMRRHAARIVEPTESDTVNSARAFVTAKMLLKEHGANALSMDCLGMVGQRLVPTPPCYSWTMLQDAGITAGCEADLFGAMSLMMASYLLDRPGYMNDPVPVTTNNTLVASHCTSGTRLAGFDEAPAPFNLRSHSESDLGVSTQVLWPEEEPATLIRFSSPHEMLIDTGQVVRNIDTPPAGGCRTSVEIAMDDIEDCRDVRGFHQVVTLGHHRRELEAFCQLYGMRAVRSPREATPFGGTS